MPAVIRTIATTIHGRYIVEGADASGAPPLLVGFHGYAESAAVHLEAMRRIPGLRGWRLASVQGLHRFYRPREQAVVASWMTREDRDHAIADNIDYVNRVVSELQREQPPGPLVYVGFSQGVATAYRAAASAGHVCAGLIALAGDVPPEVDLPVLARQSSPVLVGRGMRDEWYTAEKLEEDLRRLRAAGVSAESAVFDGGHEWTDAFLARVGLFLNAISPAAAVGDAR